MKSRKELISIIKGESPAEKREYPLFWTLEGAYAVAGPYRLTVEQFEKLKKEQTVFLEVKTN